MIEGLLVPSTNSGRYAIGNSDGPDLSGNTHIEIHIAGRWVPGRIEHATGYSSPGCYSISDRGRTRLGTRTKTQEEMQRSVNAALSEGLSLQEAIMGIESSITDVFRGYYVILDDNSILGLCTGMRVRLVS